LAKRKISKNAKKEEKTLLRRTMACSGNSTMQPPRPLRFLHIDLLDLVAFSKFHRGFHPHSFIPRIAGAAVTTITNPQNLTTLFITHDFGLYLRPFFLFFARHCVSR
jgi:hypothetical protein